MNEAAPKVPLLRFSNVVCANEYRGGSWKLSRADGVSATLKPLL